MQTKEAVPSKKTQAFSNLSYPHFAFKEPTQFKAYTIIPNSSPPLCERSYTSFEKKLSGHGEKIFFDLSIGFYNPPIIFPL